MKVVSTLTPTKAERQRDYRKRSGKAYKTRDATRKRAAYQDRSTTFVGVDGEGTGKGPDHRYVLLGCGQQQYENRAGIHWKEAFEFLYDQYRKQPNAAFVGFFLGYDFTQILKTLPQDKAWLLFTRAGKAKRRHKGDKTGSFTKVAPVRHDGWEFDILGTKRLMIRPWCCDESWQCKCRKAGWMYICDTGSFFQAPFLRVIDPKGWSKDPDGPICTEDEYRLVEIGKMGRGGAPLDDDMRMYNRLENELLARVMVRYQKGLRANGVNLSKTKWYGPGAAAEQWLRNKEIPSRELVEQWIPKWARDVFKASFIAGWFELFSHGKILQTAYCYDLNSAYPYAITRLPCIHKGHGRWKRGKGNYRGTAPYVLCHMDVKSASNRVGPVPCRRKGGAIVRPMRCKGWYWLDEIQASVRAGLVDSYTIDQWVSYEPTCECKPPLAELEEVYNFRLKVGKNSAAGKAAKLIANSTYGKNAQSIGSAPFGNWFYASRITASCRIQILDSIASHPGGADSVLMVATDGITFDSKHPNLEVSKDKLGAWDETEYDELVLFMPGVYWHRTGKERLLDVKTRGVPKKGFLRQVEYAESEIKGPIDDHWPRLWIPISFSMTSCLQALMRGKWEQAGVVESEDEEEESNIYTGEFKGPHKWISADPKNKRGRTVWNRRKKRNDSRTIVLDESEWNSVDYTGKEDEPDALSELHGIGLDGPIADTVSMTMDALKEGDELGEWQEVV